MASRALLRRLSTCNSNHNGIAPLVFGLVDYDPDGLAILSTYRHGSVALCHEHQQLATPRMRWLGLHSRDIVSSASDNACRTLLPMTARDRRKAMKTLGWPAIDAEHEQYDFRRELQIMLMLNMKAEIEAMDEEEGGLSGWLRMKLVF